MNWSNVKLILAREIRDQLRDRRTLFMIAVLPLLLYPLLGMSFFQIAQFMREQPTKVLLIGADQLDEMEGFPALVDDHRFAADLFATERQIDLVEIEFADEPPNETRTWADADPKHRQVEALQMLRSRDVQVIVYFPPKFAQPLRRFRQRLLGESDEAPPGEMETASVPSPTVYYNASKEKSQIASARVTNVLEAWRAKIARQYLRDSHVPLLAAQPFGVETSDVASRRNRDAAVWSKLMPFVLLIWALTGAFYPAIDLCAGEKERGTLETLLSSPAGRSEIVWGKLLTIMLFSVATAVLNLLSMSLTASLAISQLNQITQASEATRLSLPPLSSFLWLSVALLPIAALFSALCLALAAFARSTKEGQYYLMPLVLVTMPLMVLPMAPGVELNLGNSLIPLTGVMLLLRVLLEGNYLQALPYVLPVVAVTLGCCLLAIRWAVDQFNKESVLFRESEKLDLGLWARHLVRDRGPTPTMAEAVSCFVLILVIQFFMNLAMPATPPTEFREFALLIFTNLVVLIALPALLMTILFTRNPAKTLLLDRFPALWSIPAAVLLAIALHPLVQRVSQFVLELYPLGPEAAALDKVLKIVLNDAPYAWLPFLLLALLPAICEELAFRGFILSGLRRMGHKWGAITLSAVMFGMAHGILQQSIMAALVGVVLGYIAVQTGSLWPCMAYHLTHNSLPLLMEKVRISPTVYEQYPQFTWIIQRSVENGQENYVFGWPLLAASTVVAAALLLWFRRLPHEMTAEEELQDALEHQSAHSLAG